MTPELISIIMPVYNVEKYVGDAIRSVLSQSYQNFELIVVDDCSPDGSRAVVDSFSDPRIRIVRHETNKGLAGARNSGIEAASAGSNFLALLDSDDIMTPFRLENQMRFMERNPDVALSAGYLRILSQDSEENGRIHKSPIDVSAANASLIFGNPFPPSTWMLRRNALPTGGFRHQYAEDYDFLVRVSLTHRLAIMSEVLFDYRLHPGSIMRTTALEKKKQDIWRSQEILFDRLRINPTHEEKEIHLFTRTNAGNIDQERLRSIYAWYMKLIEANAQASVYPDGAFRLAASYMWFEHLYRATGCGVKTLEMLLRCRLSLHHPQPFSRIAKVFIKAAMHRDFKRH